MLGVVLKYLVEIIKTIFSNLSRLQAPPLLQSRADSERNCTNVSKSALFHISILENIYQNRDQYCSCRDQDPLQTPVLVALSRLEIRSVLLLAA
jgi:hypothetical protein